MISSFASLYYHRNLLACISASSRLPSKLPSIIIIRKTQGQLLSACAGVLPPTLASTMPSGAFQNDSIRFESYLRLSLFIGWSSFLPFYLLLGQVHRLLYYFVSIAHTIGAWVLRPFNEEKVDWRRFSLASQFCTSLCIGKDAMLFNDLFLHWHIDTGVMTNLLLSGRCDTLRPLLFVI
ncbi:uncharacterized protein BO97DRAFT_116350 [Aspergillus homomorphus CBS 101889]|uniref:Uncharacterized protein n=1 Tax=Aspergillus homomorphus (strain CBS 101889) TaxID=1450537 RepID=A0A395HU49_ASPHC|nr:hypothetical protein BO97DRAFT_116350 [Aspergillus homomorphus CBS 101889]RAL10915.1 hypothetical protein BO97DRAFT_116350 [Aspergillus homomorphus CBS 101889]